LCPQCIQKWLGAQQEQRCPICRRGWEFKSAEAGQQQEEEEEEEGERGQEEGEGDEDEGSDMAS